MNGAFSPGSSGVRMHLEPAEVNLLRQLVDALTTTLDTEDADDPVLERLFPTAVDGDSQADVELRRLLRDDLMERRREGIEALGGILDRARRVRRGAVEVELEDEEPHLVLGVLNDLRLAIGARIGIDQLDRAALEHDDETTYRVRVMDHLGWLQEQLLEVIDPEAVAHRGEVDAALEPDEDGAG